MKFPDKSLQRMVKSFSKMYSVNLLKLHAYNITITIIIFENISHNILLQSKNYS